MNGPEEQGTANGEQRTESHDPRMAAFEQALARAMRPVELRAATTAKLLALAEEAERKRLHAGGGLRLIRFSNRGRLFAMPRPHAWARSWIGGAIAAVLVAGCFVGAHLHAEHERRVEADRQFAIAERITDQTLARTREQLRARGIYLDQ